MYKLEPNFDEQLRSIDPSLKEEALRLSRDDLRFTTPFGTTGPVSTPEPPDQAESELKDALTTMLEAMRGLELVPTPKIKSIRSTHISILPAELVANILRKLAEEDVQSIEHVGMVCRAYYIYVRDPMLWRYIYEWTFRDTLPPMDPTVDYRHLFLETPRLRFDGVYISRCSYIRQAYSEFAFTQPIHLVVYYRYLRFFRDGTVLSLLTAIEPAQVVHNLCKENINKCGASADKDSRVLEGHYVMKNGNEITVVVSGIERRQGVVFHSELRLKSSYFGGWNKLMWQEYYSARGNSRTDYSLKSFKSYFFSRVKRYVLKKD